MFLPHPKWPGIWLLAALGALEPKGQGFYLTEWEVTFLLSIDTRDTLTLRQRQMLVRLYNKYIKPPSA